MADTSSLDIQIDQDVAKAFSLEDSAFESAFHLVSSPKFILEHKYEPLSEKILNALQTL